MMGKTAEQTKVSSSGRENKKPSYLKDYDHQNDESDKDFNEHEYSDDPDGSDESFVHGSYKKKKKRGPKTKLIEPKRKKQKISYEIVDSSPEDNS